MPLFGKGDEAENRFKEVKRCSDPRKKEFDLDKAISLLKEAVMLKPFEGKYRNKLEEINELKSKFSSKFLMQVADVFEIKGRGKIPTGRVQQGVIHPGDEVRIVGPLGERRVTVARLEMFHKTLSLAVPGDAVGLVLQGPVVVERGDTIEGVEA